MPLATSLGITAIATLASSGAKAFNIRAIRPIVLTWSLVIRIIDRRIQEYCSESGLTPIVRPFKRAGGSIDTRAVVSVDTKTVGVLDGGLTACVNAVLAI